jgi:F-box/leucine-rich repeat protein 14
MSATFSWGSNKDYSGTVIDASATELSLPISATDADIAKLAQLCKQLQTLHLDGCDKITDAGLRSLASLQQLQELNLSQCDKITDHGLVQIAEIKQLQTLYLGRCDKITDAGLMRITGLQQLQAL